MAEGRIIPHILIEADADLTDWLTEHLRAAAESARQPFLFYFSEFKSDYRNAVDKNAINRSAFNQEAVNAGLPARPRSSLSLRFMPVVRHLLGANQARGVEDAEGSSKFLTDLNRIRHHFGLPKDQPLQVVVVGSHSSIGDSLKVCHAMGQPGEEGHSQWRPNRQLASRLGAALERVEGLKLEWLANVAPDLRPGSHTSDRELLELAAAARSHLVETYDSPGTGGQGATTKPGAIPLLYVRDKSGQWRRFGDGDGKRAPHTTLELLNEFIDAGTKGAPGAGVLVKVLPEDVTSWNIADAVLLTAEQRSRALAANLKAVLVDRRYGVICPDGTQGVSVYAV